MKVTREETTLEIFFPNGTVRQVKDPLYMEQGDDYCTYGHGSINTVSGHYAVELHNIPYRIIRRKWVEDMEVPF